MGIHRGGIDQGIILRTPRNIVSDPDIICLKCYSSITLSVISVFKRFLDIAVGNGQIFSFMFLIKMLSCKRNMSSNYNLSVNILLNFCKSVDLLQNDLSYFSCWTSRKIIVIMEASYTTRHWVLFHKSKHTAEKVSVFGAILVLIFPDWVWIRTKNNSEYGHFSRSVSLLVKCSVLCIYETHFY